MQPSSQRQETLFWPLTKPEADEAQEHHHVQVHRLTAEFVACTVVVFAWHSDKQQPPLRQLQAAGWLQPAVATLLPALMRQY